MTKKYEIELCVNKKTLRNFAVNFGVGAHCH